MFSNVCWQPPAMFSLYTSSKLSRPEFEFSLKGKLKVMGSNPGYLLKSFLLYRLIVGTLFHIFVMSAIKWHVCFVDCWLIYADYQRLFVFKTFELGANFGLRSFSLGFEFETIYGKICKYMNNPTKHLLSYFGKILSWSENY